MSYTGSGLQTLTFATSVSSGQIVAGSGNRTYYLHSICVVPGTTSTFRIQTVTTGSTANVTPIPVPIGGGTAFHIQFVGNRDACLRGAKGGSLRVKSTAGTTVTGWAAVSYTTSS